MVGVPIYSPECVDFSTNGLGLVFPIECTVAETVNGEYTLHMVLPISNDGKWLDVVNGCYVKALCPVREVPDADADISDGEPETQSIFKVSGVTLAPLYRSASITDAILARLSADTEVLELDAINDTWKRVSVLNGGLTGFMRNAHLTSSRSVIITTDGGTAVDISKPRPQLFRIYSTSADMEQGEVTYEAMHVFYDLRGNVIMDHYEASNESAASVADACFSKLVNGSVPFSLYAGRLTKNISGDYDYVTPVEMLLDESTGIVPQANGIILRDNWDIYLIKDEDRNRHTTIRRGKNIVGLQINSDDSEVITRIIPCGQDKDGEPLFIDAQYVDSPIVSNYPVIRAQRIDYDVKVGDNYKDNASAKAALERMANNDFSTGCDRPTYGMEIDFVNLYDPNHSNLEALQELHINDTVTVLDEVIGLSAQIKMTAYSWDCLIERYTRITLGDFDSAKIHFWGNANVSGAGYAVQRPLEAMTENASQDCVASANSTSSSSHEPWKAFDYNLKTYWASARDGLSERWIQLQMDMPLKDLSVSVYSRGDKDHCPTAGRIMGSNDGVTWVELSTFSWAAKKSALLGTVNCENQAGYSYVRLVITDSYGSGSYVAVGYIAVTGNVAEGEPI